MSYKVVNGKVVSTKKSEQIGGAALGFQVDEKTRHIYMVRMRVEKNGRCVEENRTTFFQPGWLDFTQEQWISHRDMMLNHMNTIVKGQPHIHKVKGTVKLNVF
jgi:hypothetical protein